MPHNDPTVLLTTAGMQQMTPYFLGLSQPPAQRMASVQKCFRTVDIDEVGDESHCTFFFMLGNFSVGDYFKRESLAWSWEFLTEVLGLPAERLYPTVHPDDEDAYAIWRDEIGVPEERIGKLSRQLVGTGRRHRPNGPDSEIYFDLGPEHGAARRDCAPGAKARASSKSGTTSSWSSSSTRTVAHAAAAAACRYRHGAGAADDGHAGAESVYDTDLYQTIIQRGRAGRRDVRRGRGDRPRAPRHRRPRPRWHLPDLRRCPAGNEGRSMSCAASCAAPIRRAANSV